MGTIDPQLMHVLVRAQDSQRWDDKTRQVAGVRRDGARTLITYANGKEYAYGVDRVQIYYQVACNQITSKVSCGRTWNAFVYSPAKQSQIACVTP